MLILFRALCICIHALSFHRTIGSNARTSTYVPKSTVDNPTSNSSLPASDQSRLRRSVAIASNGPYCLRRCRYRFRRTQSFYGAALDLISAQPAVVERRMWLRPVYTCKFNSKFIVTHA